MTTVLPIRPNQVGEAKGKVLPPEVIQCWNDMIALKAVGGRAVVLIGEISEAIAAKMGVSTRQVAKNNWLDVEDLYRSVGWEVRFDRPASDESYEANFTFEEK